MSATVPYMNDYQPKPTKSIKLKLFGPRVYVPVLLLFIVIGIHVTYQHLFASTLPLSSANELFTPSSEFLIQQTTPEPEEYKPCSNIGQETDKCAFVEQWCPKNSFIYYLHFRYCTLANIPSAAATVVAVTIFSIGLILLLSLLGGTADVFFVPALQSISSELKISPAVSGLTLISLGNGAPDILTSLTAVSKGAARGEIGLVLGSLSGAAMCILNLILGLAIINAFKAYPNSNPTKLSRGAFLRAMAGLIFCLVPSIFLCITGALYWWSAAILLFCYLLYIGLNVVYLQRQETKKRRIAEEKRRQSYITSTSSYQVTRSSRSLRENLLALDDGRFETAGDIQGLNKYSLENSTVSPLDDIDSENTPQDYKLHVETDEKFDTNPPPPPQRGFSISHLLTVSTRNLLEDDEEDDETPIIPQSIPLSEMQQFDADGNPYTSVSDESDKQDDNEEDQTYFMSGLHPVSAWSQPGKKSIGTKITFIFSKAVFILTWPICLLQWLSIPSCDHRPDYLRGIKRSLLLVSPILLSFILGLNFAEFSSDDTVTWIILILSGLGLSAAMHLYWFSIVLPTVTKYNKRRKEVQDIVANKKDEDHLDDQQLQTISELVLEYNIDQDDEHAKPMVMKIFMILCNLLAFIGSIAWLSLVANELVEVLSALGVMFNISSIFLGITVLALGNSVVDLAANVSLAKQNKMNIAYSACWSAPITANSFGFGLAILFTTLTNVPVIRFEVTKPIIFCWCFVLGAIVLSCIMTPMWNYKPNIKYGIGLSIYYALFLVGSIILEFAF